MADWIAERAAAERRDKIVELVKTRTAAGELTWRSLIAKELGFTRQTASAHVNRLVEEGRLREVAGGGALEVIDAESRLTRPDEAGLEAARAVAGWHLGHRDWADRLIDAYLNPERALEALKLDKDT